ncbi:heavy metal translocating P-type ATPase [Streptomyces sp. NBC_01016]|uniref:heavy metal translocating P-type ATPase n=1 Tax=Streptomyces sp. NBC_01016 TaxID=2903720 RepID=UPI00225A841B|nr:heavy metal translocating P-type ATPase [Streptomyces sp. NBC_01016]MCX4829054.1 heavy metal translocating P-type ATPase [Streptomyces sp. NBC_01016]
MPAPVSASAPAEAAATAPAAPRATHGSRTPLLALPEARWAATATAAFLLALPLQLLGATAWLWGPLYAVAYVAGGWEPGLEGLRALREKTLDVDLLMVVAALGAAAIGQVMDGALLVVIFASSGALEALATARTEDSVRGLLDLAPATATRLTVDGTEETVPASELAIDDVLLIRPGERVGADARVVDGASDVDQATITGEPLPVPKTVGDEVFAGTLNGTGALRVRVARDPSDTVIARIVALVEEATRTKAPTQLFIERIEQRYALGMVAATLAVFLVPLAFGDALTDALLRAMTFMIVASPCAVVLATMPPLLSAIANAGRHGVLIKSAVVMERIGRTDTVAFDKTGTLTEGVPQVTELHPEPPYTEAELLTLAASVEQHSEHPVGRAIVRAATDRSLPLYPVEAFESTPGKGVSGKVSRGAGNCAPIAASAEPADKPLEISAGSPPHMGLHPTTTPGTEVAVQVNGTLAGRLTLTDTLRPTAPEAIRALAARTGTAPILLTGDHAHAAAAVAHQVGIAPGDVRAGLLPDDKAHAVRELADAGRTVLLVGDGVNDAPALAAAHTGVAMGRGGSDLALETADAVLVRDELGALERTVALSRNARRLVVQNLVIAGVFIAGLVIWDLAGHLPLPLGVAGHEGSTVLVGLNGLRLLRERAWTH